MVLRVQPVPAPAAGRDWSYTVPGNYQMDVKAVSATLATPTNPSVSPDDSGNGRPLTYTNNQWTTYSAVGPFAGASNLAVNQAIGALAHTTQIGTRVTSTDWNMANLSVGGWVKLAGNSQGKLWTADIVVASAHHGWQFGVTNDVPSRLNLQWRLGASAGNLGNVTAGAWHLVGVTYDGTNVRSYIDGALAVTTAAAATVDAVTEPMGLGGSADPGNQFPLIGAMAGWFVMNTVLAAGRWSTYYTDATTVGAAQYKADVLADSPLALWMLSDVVTTPSRLATLEVTNGTTTVADFPGGPNTSTNGFYTWTWASQAPGTYQSADATVNLVQIPDLVLPGGYTIGTVTPDLGLADSWTNINIWWDDGTIGPGPPIGPASYLNRMLIPDYGNRG